ncbi:aminotransferase class V-fold PLP-dependent enzyme [Dokdonia sp. PRO95]|uniref:aminotransferase class V-fold PLP-dependent enzyme n=1 Tax=Dokdonia sp. PRO95 TaxID=1239415 RepID=UPI00054F9C59|nr:aminotransferase class V-fold PLP-dependent enzyme [Dokdonia sp. PRO95]
MKNFAKLFPILKQYTYLNTAGSGLLSLPVMEWRQEHDLDFLIQGSILKENQAKVLTSVREKVGKLFSCKANRVALVPNFSYGFNTLVEGITTHKKVLLLEGDYPSVNWPFESRDFNLSYIKITGAIEEEIATAFAKAQPEIFAFSMVQWLSGIKISHKFLKDLKSKYPDTLFLADATQYLGTEVFDFDNSAFDAIGGSNYKWMNAGYGNALFLFKESVAEHVAPRTTGFNSIQGKYKPQEGSFLGRFEPGHQDTLNYGSLGVAIDVIRQLGMKTIDEKIKAINTKAKEAFAERGLISKEIIDRVDHGSFFNIKGDDKLVERLRNEGIITLARGEGVRVGFHYFNTEDDLNKLLALCSFK